MTRSEYLDTIDIGHQCCICEAHLKKLSNAITLLGPLGRADMPEFRKGGLLICSACYKNEIANLIYWEHNTEVKDDTDI